MPGLSHFVFLSRLEPGILIHLLCPDPPQLTLTLKSGWLVGQSVGWSIRWTGKFTFWGFFNPKSSCTCFTSPAHKRATGCFRAYGLVQNFSMPGFGDYFFGVQDL